MIAELQIKCLEIENWTRSLTLRGVDKEEIGSVELVHIEINDSTGILCSEDTF
jgi:hypothetical protein